MARWNNMNLLRYSPWRRLRRWSELRSSETGFVIVTESSMQIGGHATSAIGEDNVTIMKLARINDERKTKHPI